MAIPEGLAQTRAAGLNPQQLQALNMALACNDYLVVAGYPGTGKTSLLLVLLTCLHALGKSVLLCAYTHSALDNVLRKVMKVGPDELVRGMCRVGKADKCHDDVKELSIPQEWDSTAQVGEFMNSKWLFASTLLGACTRFAQKILYRNFKSNGDQPWATAAGRATPMKTLKQTELQNENKMK